MANGISAAAASRFLRNMQIVRDSVEDGTEEGVLEHAKDLFQTTQTGREALRVPEDSSALRRSGGVALLQDAVEKHGNPGVRVDRSNKVAIVWYGTDLTNPDGEATGDYAHFQHETNPNGHRKWLEKALFDGVRELPDDVVEGIKDELGKHFPTI